LRGNTLYKRGHVDIGENQVYQRRHIMSSKITGKEYPLLKIFSSDFEYYIPAYQRPYAWTAEETGILFDIIEF
jgi:hypothetical protein